MQEAELVGEYMVRPVLTLERVFAPPCSSAATYCGD